jgi:hypothetical protein
MTMADSSARAARRLARWRNLRINKGQWMSHWEDLARLMLPRRMGFVTQMTEGERRTEEIYDATAMRAARGLANAVGQLLRPEGEKFFIMRAEDDKLNNSDEVQDWLKRSEDHLFDAIFNPKAKFRQAVGEADTDLVVFGTAIHFIGLSLKAKRLKYFTIDLKDAEIALDDEGNPDTLFQRRRFTLRQAEIKFTKEKLSEDLRQRLIDRNEANLDTKYDFLRVVTPRANGREDAVLTRNMPFTNDWIEVDSAHEVSLGGFRDFPFVIPRWDTSSGETYGRSPGMIALPDSETANAMAETILVAGQKAADPPFFAPNDSSFDAVNSFSGGISYYDVDTAVQLRGNPFFTLDNNYNLPITRDMQFDTRQQIEAAFFKNVFNLPVRGPEMTATEVITRKEEFIREIGAVFGRLESDYLAPQIERSFTLLLRLGEFNPIPEILLEHSVRFEYTSPIKRIREQVEAAAARLWVQELREISEVKPDIMDLANLDAIGRHAGRALDLPAGMVVPHEEVETVREQRAEIQREALEREKVGQEVEIMATGGKAVKDISKALEGVPPEALQQLTEGG